MSLGHWVSASRVGHHHGQGWPIDEEVREILKKDARASGSVYATHYLILVTHRQMVPTPVLFAHTPGVTAQVEIRAHNPFALRSALTPVATQPTQGQAWCDAEGDIPRPTGSLLKGTRKVRKGLMEEQVNSSTDPQESSMKEHSTAKQGDTVAGQRSAILRGRNNSV